MRLAHTLLALLVASLVACAGPSSGSGGYMAKTDDGLMYIRWTNAGGDLAGSLTTFTGSVYEANGGSAKTIDFTGVLGGDAVTLAFGPDSGTGSWSGAIHGDELRLSAVQGDGSLVDLVLIEATDSEYRDAVAEFAARAVEAAASAERQALIDAPVTKAASELAAALSSVQSRLAERPQLVDGWPDSGSDSAVAVLAAKRDDIAKEAALWLSMDPVTCFEFGVGVEIAWQIYFVEGWDKFADGGATDAATKAWALRVTEATTKSDALATELAEAITANPGANPPATSVASASTAAREAERAVNDHLTERKSVVSEAESIREDVKTKYYDKAVALLRKNGLKPSDCNN